MSKIKPLILVVDDDRESLKIMAEVMDSSGYSVLTAPNGTEAFQLLNTNDIDVVLTDLYMPTINGMEIMNTAFKIKPETAVIIFTGHGSIENAVKAMQSGAFNYLTKPVNLEELRLTVKKALERKNLINENINLKRKVEKNYGFDNIVAHTKEMREILETVVQIAPSRANVLITGESGTGKELIANAIHYNSDRKNQPFVKLNCAVFAEGVLESELFGHEKGAFTGAIKSREGMFELADGGTLFLDEIGDIPLSTQVKMLRVLEEREFIRVGGNDTIKVDVRIITATNKDLKKAITEGTFREDLYFRLNVISIELPPLRKRQEDIPFMIHRFITEFCQDNNRPQMALQNEALESLVKYHWPGNVRELRNVIESLVVRIRGEEIKADDLPNQIRNDVPVKPVPDLGTGASVHEMEKKLIQKTLTETHGNKTKTAKILGIGLRTLYRKLKEYQLESDPLSK